MDIRMGSQDELFHEDWRDALRHAIKALGGFEVVGADLWPAKTRKGAGAWLSDCLNPERAAKLDIEEIEQLMRLARQSGVHCAMHQLSDSLGYTRPDIAPARTERQKLAEQMDRLLREFTKLADEDAAIQRERAASSTIRRGTP